MPQLPQAAAGTRLPHDSTLRYVAQTNINIPSSNIYSQQIPLSSEHAQQSSTNSIQQPPIVITSQTQRHSDPLGGFNKEKMLNFGDLAKAIPPFKDFFNNLHTYQYFQQLEQGDLIQARHAQITQQYSSSTDEGCDTDDHGGKSADVLLIIFFKIYKFI